MKRDDHRSPAQWAAEIAAHLPGNWATGKGDWPGYANLSGPDDEQLSLMSEDHNGPVPHLRIDGNFDGLRDFLPHRPRDFVINVAAAKGPQRIATEIERRLLAAGYRDALADALDRKRIHDAEDARRDAVLEQLIGILGGRRIRCTGHTARFGETDNGGTVTVRGHQVYFELEIPVSSAPLIAHALAEHHLRPK